LRLAGLINHAKRDLIGKYIDELPVLEVLPLIETFRFPALRVKHFEMAESDRSLSASVITTSILL